MMTKSKKAKAARTADKGRNVHATGAAESGISSNSDIGVESPENGVGDEKDSETGENSRRKEAIPHMRDPETGRLFLREGQVAQGSKLDDAMEKRICALIAGGLSLLDSCRICDLDAATVWRWKKKGEEMPGSRYSVFLERVMKAESQCKGLLITRCARDADWKSAAWLLKVKWPLEFTEHVRTEISGPDGTPLSLGSSQFSVIFQMPAPEPDTIEWSTVDHRSDEEKSGQSLAETIAGHRPSQPIEDPIAKIVDFPAAQNYDPLQNHGVDSYIKPKSKSGKLRR